jgi:creatinine amidohydrolase
MKNMIIFCFISAFTISCPVLANEPQTPASSLPVQYEELTALQFIKAVKESNATCIIPLGILEKHGPHLPVGTDLLDVRHLAVSAAHKEYTIVFPQYYFGQILEAKHQPGAIAYSPELVWKVLQETCDELSRNGIKKIILVNGHGGNNNFLPYFCQAQLASPRDYAVYLFTPKSDPQMEEKINKMRKTEYDGHAGEEETSTMISHRPDLVKPEEAALQSGADQKRLDNLQYSYTAIWWYARFPNHYAGDGTVGNKELGEMIINAQVDQLVKMIQEVKADVSTLKLQQQFFEESQHPLDTKQ